MHASSRQRAAEHLGAVPTPEVLLDEGRWERWARRALSGPLLLVVAPLYLGWLPLTLVGTAVYDATHRKRWTTSRFAGALGVNLGIHLSALTTVFAAWLLGARWAGRPPDRELAWDHKLQNAWAHLSWYLCARIYQMDLEVRGADQVRPGPILILARHVSLIDTLLPLLIISREQGLRLRYVMKRELLWDPLLDVLGHRWPTAFVRRDTRDALQIEHVVRLSDGSGQDDAIVVYPEGTRFSEEKRAHILDKLRRMDPQRFEREHHLQHILPPHAGGVLALLEAGNMDVLFFAHTGLEGANHFQDLLTGSLIGRHVKVEMWRISREDIPRESGKRILWLDSEWSKMDRWIHDNR